MVDVKVKKKILKKKRDIWKNSFIDNFFITLSIVMDEPKKEKKNENDCLTCISFGFMLFMKTFFILQHKLFYIYAMFGCQKKY